jgi:hypothetical protein
VEEKARDGAKEEDHLVKDQEEVRHMEERQMEKAKGRDSKGRVICVEWWDTLPGNAQKAKEKEGKEIGETKAKEKEREDFQDNAMLVENGGIRQNIVPRAKANPKVE